MILLIFLFSYPYTLVGRATIRHSTITLEVLDYYYENKLRELFSHFKLELAAPAKRTYAGRILPVDSQIFQVLSEKLSKLGLGYVVVDISITDRVWILRQRLRNGLQALVHRA